MDFWKLREIWKDKVRDEYYERFDLGDIEICDDGSARVIGTPIIFPPGTFTTWDEFLRNHEGE